MRLLFCSAQSIVASYGYCNCHYLYHSAINVRIFGHYFIVRNCGRPSAALPIARARLSLARLCANRLLM